MIRIQALKIKVEEINLEQKICEALKIKKDELIDFKIVKKSIDARNKSQIYFVYNIDAEVKNEKKILKQAKKSIMEKQDESYQLPHEGTTSLKNRPVIIGFGPAGMFAGLLLAEMGYQPIIFERGEEIEKRKLSVNQFFDMGVLNTESNIQFGEGGAGTFSDGKLTTRLKDLRIDYILKAFVECGAKDDILTDYNPHIGTDILVDVVKNIRKKIISFGGEIHFNHKLQDMTIVNNEIKKIKVNDKEIQANDVILAIGHSARDTFTMLYEKGVSIKQKAFAIGVRIEHPQLLINQAQYGDKYYDDPRLGAAEYKLTYHATNGKSVYTFCMCPGGTVVASSSEINTVVTNGMSEYKRDKENANSALVVTVDANDFKSEHPLAGMYFQRQLEEQAFILGGNNYHAPVQKVCDFLNKKPSVEIGKVTPSYPIGYQLNNLHALFPENISMALQEALLGLNQRLKGFAYQDAILTGVETRTSSPIRIIRDGKTFESENIKGLYPTGEGAGYAGGITSSAIDGMKVAERLIQKYKPFD